MKKRKEDRGGEKRAKDVKRGIRREKEKVRVERVLEVVEVNVGGLSDDFEERGDILKETIKNKIIGKRGGGKMPGPKCRRRRPRRPRDLAEGDEIEVEGLAREAEVGR